MSLKWEEAKTLVLKSALGLLLTLCLWTIRESAQATSQLKDAVSDLRAVVWELRANIQATKDQIRDMTAQQGAMETRITRMEARFEARKEGNR